MMRKSCFSCIFPELEGDSEDRRITTGHISRIENQGESAAVCGYSVVSRSWEETIQKHQASKDLERSSWSEDQDDEQTIDKTFEVLDSDHDKTISIAEIRSAASTSDDLLAEVAKVLDSHCREHNVTTIDRELFKRIIQDIPRARGHRVQWAKGLSLHNILASFLQPGTIADGLKGLKEMSENEVHSACEGFAKDATQLILSKWKDLTKPQVAENQSRGSASNSKYSMEARYGSLDDFYRGPEKRVGYPNPKVAEGMQMEHCNRENCETGFITPNYQLYTKPSWEWWYLMQLYPPREGRDQIKNASLLTEMPGSLQKRNGRVPGVYEDFFWETAVECSLKNNVGADADKLMDEVKGQLAELKERLKTDEEKCRDIRVLHDQALLSIVFPLQLEGHGELQGKLQNILDASSLSSMIVSKSFKTVKRTYVEKGHEHVDGEIQGRMPPGERAELEKFIQMMHKADLRLEEAWALCLYTGPMFMLYNARLRGFPQSLISANNKFETTIFTIISGIVKLSRVSEVPQQRLLYRGLGGLGLPQAFRDDSAECTVKLAVTFTDQERDSLEVVKKLLAEVRQVVIARTNQCQVLDVEVGVAKSIFDLLKAGQEVFRKSDLLSWNFHEESGKIHYTKQNSKQEASATSTPSIVAVVAAVLIALKTKGAQNAGIVDILKEKPARFRGGVELGLMSTTSRKEIAIQYSAGKGGARGVVFEIQVGRIDIGASLQCFSQYPGEEEFLIPPCSCVEVVNTPRIELDKACKEVVVYPVRVNVNLKCVTVEELEGRRKELHLAMFSNLIEEVWSVLKEKKDASPQQTVLRDEETALKGAEEKRYVISNEHLQQIMDGLQDVKLVHEKRELSLYLQDNEYLKLFNEAMVEKHFAAVKFDLYRKTGESDLLKILPESIRKFPWEGIVGKSDNKDSSGKAEDLDLKDWPVKGWSDLSPGRKEFLAEQLSFPVQRLIAAGVIVHFDPPNLSARSVSIRCEPQSLLNHVADRVAFLLSRYQSLCEVDIVERAAFESLTIESWRFIFEDCPRLSTVNGSFMPNRLLRPTRGAGAALIVGYCQARSAVSLDLTNLALGNEGLKLICLEMEKLGHLQYLFLDQNGLGVDCMQQFSEKVLNLKNLKALSLDGNFIESNGVKLLCDSLKSKSMDSVERLSVKGNVIPMDLLPEKLKLPANILTGQGIIGGNKQLSLGTLINSVAWSPDKSRIAAGSDDGKIVIFDAQTGEHIKEFTGHIACVKSVAWSPEGSKIVSGAGSTSLFATEPGEVIIWNSEDGSKIADLKGHARAVTSVAWSPEGSKIVSGGSGGYDSNDSELPGEIFIWDAVTGEQKTQLKGHTRSITSVAWSPEGSKIVSGGGTVGKPGEIIIWDAMRGVQKCQMKGHTNQVNSVVWSPEGSMIASGSSDKTTILWDAVTGDHHTQLKGHSDAVYSIAWNPEGSKIVSGSGDKTIITWDVKTGARLNDYKGHSGYISCVAWNPNGDLVASASGDQTVSIWDTRANCVVSQSKGHTGSVNSVSWSYDGECIATGSSDKSIMIWNVKTGSKISKLRGESAAILSTAWNPHDADLVSCGLANGSLVIWDTKCSSKRSDFKGHIGGVSCVEWNKTGEKIASGSWDGVVKVWETKSGSCVAELRGHKTKVKSVIWEEGEGKDATIISQAADGVSISWNTRTREQIRRSDQEQTS